MKNFVLHNPTKLIFGKDTISQLSVEVGPFRRIMVCFGGGSVKRNGVYEQVVSSLRGVDYIEFWGIEANPDVSTLRKAIQLGKESGIDFVLAVGGGSVIDGVKLIVAGIPSEYDAWDLVRGKRPIESILPFGTVLTLSATGSEMNCGSVISNREKQEKFAFGSAYPKFSILDPTVLYSLPPYQVANGIADTFVHVLEQYLTVIGESPLMDRWAEGILQTLVEIAPKIKVKSKDYDLMSSYMLCATMALNDFISLGISEDWATHSIGHELTALEGITHGESLAIVMPALMTVMQEQKKDKILQYGERVFGITGATAVLDTIVATKRFFSALGLATTLSEKKVSTTTIQETVKRFRERKTKMGENRNIDADIIEKILVQAD